MIKQTAESKVVTVHRGARDAYQVAAGLSQAGMLERLVTDLYWPADEPWARDIERFSPAKLSRALRCRYKQDLPASKVEAHWLSGIASLAIHKTTKIPAAWQSRAIRWCDDELGRAAGRIASETDSALLSYSYYAHSAFTHYRGNHPRILFQLHPHPASVRAILARELKLHPDCASSLNKEWELMLPEEDFKRLVSEVGMAQRWIVASRFTKQTLVDNGVPAGSIGVIPYGIDLASFTSKTHQASVKGPLQILFVGTIGQRKGIKYLLEALKMLPANRIELTVCGRVVDKLPLFRDCKIPVKLIPGISAAGLREAYHAADVFVLPSMAEGFAQVLLEAMASGLPIISTERTAAPDLIEENVEGFVTPAGDAVELAKVLERYLQEPQLACRQGQAARRRAEEFTWGRFRSRIGDFVRESMGQTKWEGQAACLSR